MTTKPLEKITIYANELFTGQHISFVVYVNHDQLDLKHEQERLNKGMLGGNNKFWSISGYSRTLK